MSDEYTPPEYEDEEPDEDDVNDFFSEEPDPALSVDELRQLEIQELVMVVQTVIRHCIFKKYPYLKDEMEKDADLNHFATIEASEAINQIYGAVIGNKVDAVVEYSEIGDVIESAIRWGSKYLGHTADDHFLKVNFGQSEETNGKKGKGRVKKFKLS